MHQDSQPGRQYIIDVEVANNGIPYADSFYVTVHFYLSKVSDTESRLSVIGNIKYRKTVWGLVKSKTKNSQKNSHVKFRENFMKKKITKNLHLKFMKKIYEKFVIKIHRKKKSLKNFSKIIFFIIICSFY